MKEKLKYGYLPGNAIIYLFYVIIAHLQQVVVLAREVVIVGGGTSGLILARELGRRGIGATVFESEKKIGTKADKASGILSASGLSKLGIGFSDAIVNTLYGASLHAGKRSLHVRSEKLQAYVLDRIRLAEICADEAKNAGAKIATGKKIGTEELEQFSADGKIIVGADGGLSAVARWAKFPPIADHILTFKALFEDSERSTDDEVDLFFSERFANGFFGWAVPYGKGIVELGIGTKSGSWNSSEAFRRMMGEDSVKEAVGGGKMVDSKASIIPVGTRSYTAKGEVMLVGDAAGQVKATTGGGIIFGGACAIVAAESISKHLERGEPLERYDKRWRKLYGNDLSMHRFIHAYYSKAGEAGVERLLWLLDTLGMGGFLSKYGDMDRPSLMVKRFFLRGLAN